MTQTDALIASARTLVAGARPVAGRLAMVLSHPCPSHMCRAGLSHAFVRFTPPAARNGASAEL